MSTSMVNEAHSFATMFLNVSCIPGIGKWTSHSSPTVSMMADGACR